MCANTVISYLLLHSNPETLDLFKHCVTRWEFFSSKNVFVMYFSAKQIFCLNIQYSDRQWIPGEPLTMPAAFQNARTVDCQLPNDGQQSDVMDVVDDKPIARWQIKVLSEMSDIHLQIFLLRWKCIM